MVKEKRKNILSGYSDYEKLTYFRWKALIRSKEYQDFYDSYHIKDLIEKKMELDQLFSDICKIIEGYSVSPEQYFRDRKKQELLSGFTRSDIEKIEEYYDEKSEFDAEKRYIVKEADNNFGVLVEDIIDLRPIDMPIDEVLMCICFRDYFSQMPQESGEYYRRIAAEEIKKEDIEDNKYDRSTLVWHLSHGDRLFLINTDMPALFCAKALLTRLRGDSVKPKLRSDRKEFHKWEEAFQVWDLYRQTGNLYKTAQKMGWEKKKNRKGIEYNKEELRNMVRNKRDVADKLIDLAGQGKFVSL